MLSFSTKYQTGREPTRGASHTNKLNKFKQYFKINNSNTHPTHKINTEVWPTLYKLNRI